MKLWRRASGIIKDKNSLWIASVSRRSKYCHPDLEAAVIKATSHDETSVDYKNSQRVFQWVRTSPLYFVPFMWALTRRMEKTHDWVVAVKGLMLLHGVLCTKITPALKVGRLPFDLSNFNATSLSKLPKHWAYNVFVRSYYAFLDQKAVVMSREFQEKLESQLKNIKKEEKEETIMQRLTKLQHWQNSLDLLLQVKPRGRGMNGVVILEAMDCVIIEVFDVYSKICDGVANVLVRIYAAAGKLEASMALDVLHRATRQGDELSEYFELCREIGLLNASECPKVERVPEEDIRELEKIIRGDGWRGGYETPFGFVSEEERLAMVVSTDQWDNNSNNNNNGRKESDRSSLRTVITDKWEVFEEEEQQQEGGVIDLSDLDTNNNNNSATTVDDPFAASLNFPPCLVTTPNHYYDIIHDNYNNGYITYYHGGTTNPANVISIM